MKRSTVRVSWLATVALMTLAVIPACKRGGSSSDAPSVFAITHTSFGFDPTTGTFNSTGERGEAPIIPQNTCIVFEFNANLNASTVSSETIIVQEINTSVTPPAPGPDAGVTFRVTGNRLIICPLILFSDTNVSFGMQPDRTYQVLFQVPPQQSVVRSAGGSPLRESNRGPFKFKTNSQIFDIVPGAPKPTVSLIDESGAQLTATAAPFRPVPRVRIDFNEPVIPTTVVSDPTLGASNSVRVELEGDGDLTTLGDRITIPGRYSLTQDDQSARLSWQSLLQEIPTNANGQMYVVTIRGTVQDLSGNNRVILESDPGAKDEFVFFTQPGNPNTMPDPLVETFDVRDQEDQTVTSAFWGTLSAGLLTPGFGGGTGRDGQFDPNDPVFVASVNANPNDEIAIDTTTQIATLHTVNNNGSQRQFEFLSFTVPLGWVVRGTGNFPLNIQVSGDVLIQGILDVSGAPGATIRPFDSTGQPALAGGLGGAAALGGAAGGHGGGPVDATGATTFYPATAVPNYAQLGFFNPGGHEGVSGRATTIDDFLLVDANLSVDLSTLDVTHLWIQPNVAADDFRFERFHPAFKVERIDPGNFIHIVSDPTSRFYRGPITAPTVNPTLEFDPQTQALRAPLIAEECDAYVLGELAGTAGSKTFDLNLNGVLAEVPLYEAGSGSDPQAVMQTTVTTASSGGGGGGGAMEAATRGADDPTVDNGPGPFGGSGWIGGEGGVRARRATVLNVLSNTRIELEKNFFIDANGSFAPALYAGYLLNPNISQGHRFQILNIESARICQVRTIPLVDGTTLDFASVSGLQPGATVRIEPPFTVGGTGGGGAGAHCGGSFKDPKGHRGVAPLSGQQAGSSPGFYDDDNDVARDCLEDTQERLFRLPQWVPGAGGGAGGGALRLVTASDISVTTSGMVLAEGGRGGESTQAGATASSGGGGAAGGSIFLGAGRSVTVSGSGRISAAGGAGGGTGTAVKGGQGATGRIRIESVTVQLDPVEYAGKTSPVVAAKNLGVFTGGGNSLAQSEFLSAGVLVPKYQQIVVTYNYTQNGTRVTGARLIIDRNGNVAPGSSLPTAPFQLQVNFTGADPLTGLAMDPQGAAATFVDPATPLGALSNFDGQGYIRFRFTLDDAANPAFPQLQVNIDSIEITIEGAAP